MRPYTDGSQAGRRGRGGAGEGPGRGYASLGLIPGGPSGIIASSLARSRSMWRAGNGLQERRRTLGIAVVTVGPVRRMHGRLSDCCRC